MNEEKDHLSEGQDALSHGEGRGDTHPPPPLNSARPRKIGLSEKALAIRAQKMKESIADIDENGVAVIGENTSRHFTFSVSGKHKGGVNKTVKEKRTPNKVANHMLYRLAGVKVGKMRYACIFDAAVQTLLEAMGERDENGFTTPNALKAAVKFIEIGVPTQKGGDTNVLNLNAENIDVTVEALQRVRSGLESGEVRDIFTANASGTPMLGLGKEPPTVPVDVFEDIPKPPEKIFIPGFSSGYEHMEIPKNGNGHSPQYNAAHNGNGHTNGNGTH